MANTSWLRRTAPVLATIIGSGCATGEGHDREKMIGSVSFVIPPNITPPAVVDSLSTFMSFDDDELDARVYVQGTIVDDGCYRLFVLHGFVYEGDDDHVESTGDYLFGIETWFLRKESEDGLDVTDMEERDVSREGASGKEFTLTSTGSNGTRKLQSIRAFILGSQVVIEGLSTTAAGASTRDMLTILDACDVHWKFSDNEILE